MLKLCVDINKIRTGSVLKDCFGYYTVIGISMPVLDETTVMIVVPTETKPTMQDVEANIQKAQVSYLLNDVESFAAFGYDRVYYDYFSKEKSTVLLTKYNLTFTPIFYQLQLKIVTAKDIKEGNYYQDFTQSVCTAWSPFYQCRNGVLVDISLKEEKPSRYNSDLEVRVICTHDKDTYMEKSTQLLEVDKGYINEFYSRLS